MIYPLWWWHSVTVVTWQQFKHGNGSKIEPTLGHSVGRNKPAAVEVQGKPYEPCWVRGCKSLLRLPRTCRSSIQMKLANTPELWLTDFFKYKKIHWSPSEIPRSCKVWVVAEESGNHKIFRITGAPYIYEAWDIFFSHLGVILHKSRVDVSAFQPAAKQVASLSGMQYLLDKIEDLLGDLFQGPGGWRMWWCDPRTWVRTLGWLYVVFLEHP